MPSLGELIVIPTLEEPITPEENKILYEDVADEKFGTGQNLNDIAAQISDTDMQAAEQGATMQFLKMEAMVESICDMSANKRHGLITGSPGCGKNLSNTSKLLLSDNSWGTIGDSKVGDYILTPEKLKAKIITKYEFPNHPIYNITLEDNTIIGSGEEHLWLVRKNDLEFVVNTRFLLTYGWEGYLIPQALEHELKYLNIKNIEYKGIEDAACITIDDPKHLFITNNYVVTHNCLAYDELITIRVDNENYDIIQNFLNSDHKKVS
jgi:hypothetical protein